MYKNENLIDWYKSLNEEDIEGVTRITVPVIEPKSDEPDLGSSCQSGMEPAEPETVVVVNKENDPVVEKDKDVSMIIFILTKKLQNLIIRLGDLESPYSDESEERQGLIDKITDIYKALGENVSKL